jgi:hypothetical protein
VLTATVVTSCASVTDSLSVNLITRTAQCKLCTRALPTLPWPRKDSRVRVAAPSFLLPTQITWTQFSDAHLAMASATPVGLQNTYRPSNEHAVFIRIIHPIIRIIHCFIRIVRHIVPYLYMFIGAFYTFWHKPKRL